MAKQGGYALVSVAVVYVVTRFLLALWRDTQRTKEESRRITAGSLDPADWEKRIGDVVRKELLDHRRAVREIMREVVADEICQWLGVGMRNKRDRREDE